MRTLYLVSVWLHIVAAAAWLGGMLFLVLVVVPALRTPALAAHAAAALKVLGERYRTVGWTTLLVLVVTGTANLAFRAGSAIAEGAWWATPFGRILAAKLALVAVVLALSALHDFRVGPRAGRLMLEAPDEPRTARWRAAARWMGRINLLLALAIVALAVRLVRG
jgi:putative copper resistance protein D